ncbi:MAG: ribosomal L7Ae/L30e/S12e/Gadd45 family protein [Clostridiales bacterium]|nr:ribosomal L7Ae/L30e/S12e/Gadd45 family protein [Candidatus Cacconaster stercorequi]
MLSVLANREGHSVLEELMTKEKVTGLKQTRRAIAAGRARQVYLACDADPRLTEPIRVGCQAAQIPTVTEFTMAQLGKVCGIDVGCAAATVLAK